MKLSKVLLMALMGFALIFSGCKELGDPLNPNDPGSGGDTEHSSNITKDETWGKNKIHIVDGYIGISNATLTIEAGTIVKFKENSKISVGESGGLIADGTAEAIKFTGTTEQNGYWYYIGFDKNANNEDCKLINCIIEYGGGYADYSASLKIYNNTIVKNCTIRNSESNGVYIDDDAKPEFTGNTITNCDESPIKGYFSSSKYIGQGTYTGNGLDYIYLSADELKKNATLLKQDVPYVIDGYATISNAILNIDVGTTVKFDADSKLTVDENGGLVAMGSATDMITFGGKRSQKGYWYYIAFSSTAVSASSILSYCIIEDGGGYADYSAAIKVYNNATIENCIIRKSESAGVYIDDDARPNVFNGNTITDNEEWPIKATMENITAIGTGDYSGNASNRDYIFIDGGKFKSVGTVLKQNVPYLLDGYCYIENGTLTVEPGSEIDFYADSKLAVGTNGGFCADGTVSDPILISGYIKQKGYWYYIGFASDADNANCKLNNCTLEYGGGYADYTGIVEVDNGATVTNNIIRHSKGWGIVYDSSMSPTISNNTYADCVSGNKHDTN